LGWKKRLKGKMLLSTRKPKGGRAASRAATPELLGILARNHAGAAAGIYSICSANRYVLEAGMIQASRDGNLLCIESTSNQVNQFGGYTGQTPCDFAEFVHVLAREMKFPVEKILLGGDHLGPHVWRAEKASGAMGKACELVKRCVLAGYTKIHLDASMHCADDPGDRGKPLAEEIVSDRAAELCRAAEEAYQELPAGSPAPLYVIGTEVPVPGGEQAEMQSPEATNTADLSQTLEQAKKAFSARKLQGAWERVIAVVVQPGVEFGDDRIFPYDAAKAKQLSRYARARWKRAYEAHSTDFQAPCALRQMVQDHFAILKVGPWLTFAFREAVFALAAIEKEWLGLKKESVVSRVREVLEQAMLEDASHWEAYYRGDEETMRFARRYSYSDRSRYYWPQPAVAAALKQLLENLTRNPAPLPLVSQYLPNQAAAIREGRLEKNPLDLIHSKILEVLDIYARACGLGAGEGNERQNVAKRVGAC
jgi:D-tagatose-1,6-bisphosphate aldolase subunit GatZ/KbaZ